MLQLLRRYANFVVRRAWLVLVVSVVFAALLATGMRKLAIELDPEAQLPADHPYVVIDRQIRKDFGGKQFVAIALVPQSGNVWTKEVLQAVHGVTFDLLNAPGIIRQNVVSLASPYARVPTDRGGSLSVEYLMRDVPADDVGITELADRYRSEPLFKGTVVSDDERAALVLADFYDDAKVADIAATVRDLTGRGVVFLRYDGMDQDENGIWTTPGGDKVAWFADPDGNVLSLTQFAGHPGGISG